MAPVMPPPPPGAPTVRVSDGTYTADEPVLGVGRYADGSIIVVAYRDPPWTPTAGEAIYRTRGNGTDWNMVWACPRALSDFITTKPPGTTGRASNRRIEVLDHTAIPNARIVISREGDNWVGY